MDYEEDMEQNRLPNYHSEWVTIERKKHDDFEDEHEDCDRNIRTNYNNILVDYTFDIEYNYDYNYE